jgi:hypothetical protein
LRSEQITVFLRKGVLLAKITIQTLASTSQEVGAKNDGEKGTFIKSKSTMKKTTIEETRVIRRKELETATLLKRSQDTELELVASTISRDREATTIRGTKRWL